MSLTGNVPLTDEELRWHQRVAVEAVVMYFYNVSPLEQILNLFPGAILAYQEEWIAYYQDGFTTFWGRLDSSNKQRYVQAALNGYELEARKRIGG